MDIPKDFSLSYHALIRNKVLVLPHLIGSFITIALILVLLLASGLYGVVAQYSSLAAKYQQEHKTLTGQMDNQDLSKYLEANGLNFLEFRNLLSWNNLILAIVVISAIIIINYYLSAVLLAMASWVVKNKKLDYKKILSTSFWLMFRFAWYHFLIILTIALPICLMILAVTLFFLVNKWLGILSIIAIVILIIAYTIFIAVKLIFAQPLMFIEDETAFSSLKTSYSITKSRFKEALIVFAIIFGIGLAFSFAGNMWGQIFVGIIAFKNALTLLLNIVVLILFFVISCAVNAFVRLFLYYSYLDFRSNKNGKTKVQQ